MGFNVENPVSPIATGGLSLLTGQAEHDEKQRQLDLAHQQAQDQLAQEYQLRKQALDQQKQATQNQADEARQRAQLEADGQSLTYIDQQNQLRAQQAAHSNSIYASLAGQLIGSDRQDRAQAEQDQRQQALFQQQETLRNDQDQQQMIMQGLKAGTLRWSPQQKQEQAQLQDAMHRVDGDQRLSPEQKQQAHAQFTQRLNSMRPMQVPADEVPPTPQEQLEHLAPEVTLSDGSKVRMSKDRNGVPKEFISEAQKAQIEIDKQQKILDLKAAHDIAVHNASEAARQKLEDGKLNLPFRDQYRRDPRIQSQVHTDAIARLKAAHADEEGYSPTDDEIEQAEENIISARDRRSRGVALPPQTTDYQPEVPGGGPADPQFDPSGPTTTLGTPSAQPPQQADDASPQFSDINDAAAALSAPQGQQQSPQAPPPVATYNTRDQVVADIKAHRLKVGDWVQTPRGTRQLTPDDIQAAGT